MSKRHKQWAFNESGKTHNLGPRDTVWHHITEGKAEANRKHVNIAFLFTFVLYYYCIPSRQGRAP